MSDAALILLTLLVVLLILSYWLTHRAENRQLKASKQADTEIVQRCLDLLQALQPPSTPRLGDAQDQAPRQAALPAATPPLREPTAWLVLVIVLLFALERWMASSARRRAAP